MGFQSSINQALGAVAGAAFGIKKNLQQRQEEALKQAEEKQKALKVLRRNFMQYLRKQPTSLGGTVGELPPNMLKQIASQYTKSQRKQLMDAMDKEKKGK